MIDKPCFYILSGGPGAGKTSVWEELKMRGYLCVPEVARELIREQMALGGDALPWKDMGKYSGRMFERSVRDFENNASISQTCFFDRGVPDTLAHIRLNGLPDYNLYKERSDLYVYNRLVFLFPPWEEIYHTDKERKQSFATAQETFYVIRDIYCESGYTMVEVPRLSIKERTDFITELISSGKD